MKETTILRINNINSIRDEESQVLAVMNGINRKIVFWVLLGILVSCSGFYLYFVTQTIINTATYEKIEKNIGALNSDLGELEAESIALKRKVDLDLVKKLGYEEVSNIKFVDRNIINQTLSLVKTTN